MQSLLNFVVIILFFNMHYQFISANEFYQLWLNFIDQEIENNKQWIEFYENNEHWTKFTIGDKKSEEINSPFGEFVKAKKNLRYRKEDGLTDLSFFSSKFFSNVQSLHTKKDDRKDVLSGINKHPVFYEILVEHENNIYLCYEEMIKLTYDRARLKVLITYNENVDKENYYKEIIDVLVKNFMVIISQSNQFYPENKETEYLLIVGQMGKSNLKWYSYSFDYKGKLK